MIDLQGEMFSDGKTLFVLPEDILLLNDDHTLELLATTRRLRARVEAIETMALAHFAALRGDARGTDDEVGYELCLTRHTAATRLDTATQLITRHPAVVEAMRRGEVDGYAASRVVAATKNLSDGKAHEVDAALDGRLKGQNPADIHRMARAAVLKVDPEGEAERGRKARADRRVELIPGEDTMSTLIADLPAEVASAAYASIDREARRLRGAGEDRTLDQLRADILGQRLIGGDGATAGVQVMLHMPLSTALSITDHGCELDGYGPIPGPIARQIMTDPNSVWRKVICDPTTGAVQDLGRRRYRPTPAIRDIVTTRDRECAVPGCHRAAIACDFDHLQARARDGVTSVDNGDALCQHHNLLKEEPRWDLFKEDDTYMLVTPTGRRYSEPKRTIPEPEPEPAPKTRTTPRRPAILTGEQPRMATPGCDPRCISA